MVFSAINGDDDMDIPPDTPIESPRSHWAHMKRNRVAAILTKLTCKCFAEKFMNTEGTNLEARLKFLRTLFRILLNLFTAFTSFIVFYSQFDESISNCMEHVYFKLFIVSFSFVFLFPALMDAAMTVLFFEMVDNSQNVDMEIPKFQADLSSTLGNVTLCFVSSILVIPFPFLILRAILKLLYMSSPHQWCMLMGLIKYCSTLSLFFTTWILVSSQTQIPEIIFSMVTIYFLANIETFVMTQLNHQKRQEKIASLRMFYQVQEIYLAESPSISRNMKLDYNEHISHLGGLSERQDSMEEIDIMATKKGFRTSILTMKREPMSSASRERDAPYRRIVGKSESPHTGKRNTFWNRRQKVLDLQHRGRLSTLGIQADM